jgi:hypothetical protein
VVYSPAVVGLDLGADEGLDVVGLDDGADTCNTRERRTMKSICISSGIQNDMKIIVSTYCLIKSMVVYSPAVVGLVVGMDEGLEVGLDDGADTYNTSESRTMKSICISSGIQKI